MEKAHFRGFTHRENITMYTFVTLSALVAACAAQIPYDTPEVAHAKAAHFAAVADVQARTFGAPIIPAPVPVAPHTPVFAPAPIAPAWKSWNGIPAPIVVANDHIQDTVEVAAEKAKHFAFVADAATRAFTTGVQNDGKYRHDPSGDYRHTIVPLAPTAPLPYQFAPAPAVIPATRLYDDGLYHQDIAGNIIHRLVPAPHN